MYSRTISRYPLVNVGETSIDMPCGAKVLSVHFRRTELELHVMEDAEPGYLELRRFISLTVAGGSFPRFVSTYIGWAVRDEKIYHVFEKEGL